MEFQVKVFPGFTTLQFLAEIQNMMSDNHSELFRDTLEAILLILRYRTM